MPEKGTYTVEVEHSGGTARITEHNTDPESLKSHAVKCVPTSNTLHRVGAWSGGQSDRPDGGHEDGLLENE